MDLERRKREGVMGPVIVALRSRAKLRCVLFAFFTLPALGIIVSCSTKSEDADLLVDRVHEAINAARVKGATTAEVRFAPAEAGDYVLVILPNRSFDQAELVSAGLGAEEARALHEIHGKRKAGGSTLTVFTIVV